MNEILVTDCETDGLLNEMTKVHMLQVGTLAGEDVTIYADGIPEEVIAEARAKGLKADIRPYAEGVARIAAADINYGHNFISFDLEAINRFDPGTIRKERVRDTMVMSRLLVPAQFDHRLSACARRAGGEMKGDFKGPWHTVTADMLVYAEQDIPACRSVVRHLLPLLPGSEVALACEGSVQYWIGKQERNGVHFNAAAAEKQLIELTCAKRDLERQLRGVFPPRWVSAGEVVPYRSDSRRGHSTYTVPVPAVWVPDEKGRVLSTAKVKQGFVTIGCRYTRVIYDEFSPSSRQAICARLMERGWKPRQFTDGGGPKMDEEVLTGLSTRFPEAKALVEYFNLEKSIAFLTAWLQACVSGKIHGRVNPLGAYTQRMTHQKPNMAQVPKGGTERSFFGPRRGWRFVGCDGEGIQARGLAHYLFGWDNGKYGSIIVNGNKDDGTDIHTLNAKAMSRLFPELMEMKHRRDTAKNCNYAIYFGAQDARLGQTVKDGTMGYAKMRPSGVPNRELGGAVRRALETNMVGLSKLTELVERTYEKRKFLVGIDGRKLYPPSKRNALVTIIQALEAVLMKHALVMFCDEIAPALGWVWDVDWALCLNVHDEVQIECRPEIAEELGKAFADCIKQAAIRLNLKCEFAGAYMVGDNWHDTH